MKPIAQKKQRVLPPWLAGLAAATLAMLLLLVWQLDADPERDRGAEEQTGVSSSPQGVRAPTWFMQQPLGQSRLILEPEGVRSRPAAPFPLYRERARNAQPPLGVSLELSDPARLRSPPDLLAPRKKFLTREQSGLGVPVPHENMAPEPTLDETTSETPGDSPVVLGDGR